MENAYAQALWQIIEKGTPQAEAVRSLHSFLKESGREALLPRIAKAFERIAATRARHDMAILTVADAKHEHYAQEAAAAFGVKAKKMTVVVDTTLIGGWRLDARETLVDASYKKHLLELYRRTTNV